MDCAFKRAEVRYRNEEGEMKVKCYCTIHGGEREIGFNCGREHCGDYRDRTKRNKDEFNSFEEAIDFFNGEYRVKHCAEYEKMVGKSGVAVAFMVWLFERVDKSFIEVDFEKYASVCKSKLHMV